MRGRKESSPLYVAAAVLFTIFHSVGALAQVPAKLDRLNRIEHVDVAAVASALGVLPPRQIATHLDVTISVVHPDGSEASPLHTRGHTDEALEVVVPSCFAWFARPAVRLSIEELVSEARDGEWSGLALSRAEEGFPPTRGYHVQYSMARNVTGSLHGLRSVPSLRWLELTGPVSDEEAVAIGSMHGLRVLDITMADVSERGLRAIFNNESLSVIRLGSRTHIPAVGGGLRALSAGRLDAASLQRIRDAKGLRYLSFDGSHMGGGNSIAELISVTTQLSHIAILSPAGAVDLSKFGSLEQLTVLSYSMDPPLPDVLLAAVPHLPSLRSIQISGAEIPATGMRSIAQSHRIEQMDFADSKLPEGALLSLRSIPQLRELYLCRTNAVWPDMQVDCVDEHWRGLEVLSLLGCSQVSALTGIENLQSLRELDLRGTTIGDHDVKRLAMLSSLGSLRIASPRLTGLTVSYLRASDSLRDLGLQGMAIGDQGLVALGGITQLERLELTFCGPFSEEAVEAFREANHKCQLDILD